MESIETSAIRDFISKELEELLRHTLDVWFDAHSICFLSFNQRKELVQGLISGCPAVLTPFKSLPEALADPRVTILIDERLKDVPLWKVPSVCQDLGISVDRDSDSQVRSLLRLSRLIDDQELTMVCLNTL
jgi:hypothetical protein